MKKKIGDPISLTYILRKIFDPVFHTNNKKSRYQFIVSIFFLLVATALMLILPFLYKDIIDHFVNNKELITLPLLLVFSYGLTQILSSLFSQLKDVLFTSVTITFLVENSLALIKHLSALSMNFHLTHKSGAISKDVSRGLTSLVALSSMMSFSLLPTLFQSIAIIIIVFFKFHVLILSTLLVFGILYFLVSYYASLAFVRSQKKFISKDSMLNAKLIEILTQIDSIKYFSGEEEELAKYQKRVNSYSSSLLDRQKKLSLMMFLQNLVIGSAYIAILLLASSRYLHGTITIGGFVLLFALSTQFLMPLSQLGFFYSQFQTSMVNIRRMFAYLNTGTMIKDKPDATELIVTKGGIQFRDVSFSYQPDFPIYKNFNLTVQPGEMLALVGQNGCGKSTLIKLLYRLYDPDSGDILIDNQCIRDITKKSLRQSIAFVPQDIAKFNLSLYKNLTYPNFSIQRDKVLTVLERCGLTHMLARLPKGLDTVLDEDGISLSGGEYQRVNIARALLQDTKIIVFDEATSDLDIETQSIVQNLIEEVCADKTVIIIAHRISTLRHADRIVVLDAGEIVESGTHDKLLELNAIYHSLWKKLINEK